MFKPNSFKRYLLSLLIIVLTSAQLVAIPSAHAINVSDDPAWQLIDLQKARDLGIDGTGWTIASIDSGIQLDNPYIKDAMVDDGYCYVPGNGCANGENEMKGVGAGQSAKSADGTWSHQSTHGTSTAGVALGRPNADSSGGIAPGAKIFEANNMGNSNNGTDEGIYKSLQYIYERRNVHKFAAVYISQGGWSPKRANYSDCSSNLQKVSELITSLKVAGIPVLVASGNGFNTGGVNSIGCVADAISIGAADSTTVVTNFSNISPKVDFLAPGCSKSSDYPGKYGLFCGTSGSAPIVAGAIALLRQANPAITFDEIIATLKSTATPVDDVITKNLPLINIGKALEMVLCRNLNPRIVSTAISQVGADKYRINWKVANSPTNVRVVINSQEVIKTNGSDGFYDIDTSNAASLLVLKVEAMDAKGVVTSSAEKSLNIPKNTLNLSCTPTGKHLANNAPNLPDMHYYKDNYLLNMYVVDIDPNACLYIEIVGKAAPNGAYIFRSLASKTNPQLLSFFLGNTFDVDSKFVIRMTNVYSNGDYSDIFEQWFYQTGYDIWWPGWKDPTEYPVVSAFPENQGILQTPALSKVTDFQEIAAATPKVSCLAIFPRIESATVTSVTENTADINWTVGPGTKYVRLTVDNQDTFTFSGSNLTGTFQTKKANESTAQTVLLEALDDRQVVFFRKYLAISFLVNNAPAECSPVGNLLTSYQIPHLVAITGYINSHNLNLAFRADRPECIYTELTTDANPDVAYVSRSRYGTNGHSNDVLSVPKDFNYSQPFSIRSILVLGSGDFSLPMVRHFSKGLPTVATGDYASPNTNLVSPELMGMPQPVLLSDANFLKFMVTKSVDYTSSPTNLSDQLDAFAAALAQAKADSKTSSDLASQAQAAAKAASDAQAKAEAETKAASDAQAKAEAETKAALDAQAKAQAEAKAATDAQAKAQAEAKAALDAQAKAQAEAKAATDAQAKAEAEAKAATDAAAQAQAEAKAASDAQAKAQAKAQAETKAASDAAITALAQVAQLQAALIKKSQITITCIKGKTTKKITGLKPVCPAGFKKKP